MRYDPHRSPFDLPVQALRFRLESRRPICLSGGVGATAGTTLAGAFGNALMESGCVRRVGGGRRCPLLRTGGVDCAFRAACVLPRVHKPESPVHLRPFAAPILLRAPELEAGESVETFDLWVTLWGRRALLARDLAAAAVGRLAHVGLDTPGGRESFEVTDAIVSPAVSLAEAMGDSPGALGDPVRVDTVTPLSLGRSTPSAPTQDAGVAWRAFSSALQNAAYELVAWDIEDREVGETVTREERDSCAEAARDACAEACAAARCVAGRLAPVHLGGRMSRGQRTRLPLRGISGFASLEGDLRGLVPWLTAAALGRMGQLRSFGFGQVTVTAQHPR